MIRSHRVARMAHNQVIVTRRNNGLVHPDCTSVNEHEVSSGVDAAVYPNKGGPVLMAHVHLTCAVVVRRFGEETRALP